MLGQVSEKIHLGGLCLPTFKSNVHPWEKKASQTRQALAKSRLEAPGLQNSVSGVGCRSVTEHLSSMCQEALVSTPVLQKDRGSKQRKKEGRKDDPKLAANMEPGPMLLSPGGGS